MSPLESPQRTSSLPAVIASAACQSRYWLQRQMVLTNLTVVLGLAGSLAMIHAIAPPAVHAYTGTVNVTIDVQPSETYDTLIRRAEAIARAATQRSLDRDILVTDVAIVIIARHAASTVPVLSLAITRSQWRSQPDPRRWATYYSTAKALLGLDQAIPAATTVTQPTVTPSTPTATPTSPQPRSLSPNTLTAPTATPDNAADNPQTPTTATPSPILPSRIPTPGTIGK